MDNQQAEQVLKDIENGPDSFMIIGREKGQILADLIKKHSSKNILEVGTNLGYSSILMSMHLPDGGNITTLEMQQNSADRAQENINKANLTGKIKILVGKAQDTIPALSEKYDFVFIDAAKTEYLDYLTAIEGKLLPGAVIVADNVGVFATEVQNYTTYVKTSGKYQSTTIAVGTDAMEVSILSH